VTKIAKTLGLTMGAVLLVLGILSFLPTGIVGPGGLLVKYPGVPFVHIASGVILMGFATMGESWAAFGLYSVALLHAVLAGLGYASVDFTQTSTLFGVLRLTRGDLVLHAVLAVGLAICGKMNTTKQQVIWD
jgi:hypothetical protein